MIQYIAAEDVVDIIAGVVLDALLQNKMHKSSGTSVVLLAAS